MRCALCYATIAVEVGVAAVSKDLGEAGIQVKGVVGGYPIHGLLQTVAEAAISIAGHRSCTADMDQPVGGIIRIGILPIEEQVTVGVPGVSHPIHAGQAVGDVVGVGVGAFERLLR